ncbi:MAG: hypothetical protein UIC64_06580 [Agathobacter sp.]|nr:hypothetical protein [Agathobacter sp.]
MNKNYYVYGNTVRELEQPVRRERRSREEIETARRKKNRRNATRRNRERVLRMNKGYVVFLSLCVLLSAFAAVSLIQIQSQMSQRMKNVANLESQIANLRADNDAKYKELTTSVDLEYVKDVAMNQLGMTYATEEQVIYYSIDNENYMDQYSNIPE